MSVLTGRTDIRHARILVVDDEPSNLRLADAMLQLEGYTDIVLLQDPRDVMQRYAEAPVDLILLDLNMPRLDGYAVLAQLQALQDPLLPPVLVLTAQSGQAHALRAWVQEPGTSSPSPSTAASC